MSWRLRTDPSGFATRWSDDAAACYRAAGYWRDETLADVARRAYRQAPDRLLLIEGDHRVTRAEAWNAAARVTLVLLSRWLDWRALVTVVQPEQFQKRMRERLCGPPAESQEVK